ncbi:MAG: hypothetical protein QOC83_2232 [Pseudonocardiales bacterium]|nr:hypothetical protein [Pseudonocardiales bacterium]
MNTRHRTGVETLENQSGNQRGSGARSVDDVDDVNRRQPPASAGSLGCGVSGVVCTSIQPNSDSGSDAMIA